MLKAQFEQFKNKIKLKKRRWCFHPCHFTFRRVNDPAQGLGLSAACSRQKLQSKPLWSAANFIGPADGGERCRLHPEGLKQELRGYTPPVQSWPVTGTPTRRINSDELFLFTYTSPRRSHHRGSEPGDPRWGETCVKRLSYSAYAQPNLEAQRCSHFHFIH